MVAKRRLEGSLKGFGMFRFFNEAWMRQSGDHQAAWKRYLAYVTDENNPLPASSKEFVKEEVNLHDCLIEEAVIGQELKIKLLGEDIGILLSYGNYYLSRKDKIVLNRVRTDNRYTVAYDEFVEDDGDFFHQFSFFILDGLDGELRILFEHFDFSMFRVEST